MFIRGKLEYKNHNYTFEVVLKDISEDALSKAFFLTIINDKGQQRCSIWLYEQESLKERLLVIIQQKKLLHGE